MIDEVFALRPESAQQAAGKSHGLRVFTLLRASRGWDEWDGFTAPRRRYCPVARQQWFVSHGSELVLCRHKIITSFKARQYLNGSGGGGGSAEVKGLPPETTAESEQVPGQVSQLEDTVSPLQPDLDS